jgi:protein Mpv17
MTLQSLLSLLLVHGLLYGHRVAAWMPVSQPITTTTTRAVIRGGFHGVRLYGSREEAHKRLSVPLFSALRASSVDLETRTIQDTTEEPQLPEPPTSEPSPNGDLELELKDKVINGLFLSAAFGYALYTIFSIDQGITRGWTAPEIAMRIPLDNWGAYESYLANKPVVTKTLINVIIYLLGDWLSQTVFQKKNILDFDIKRTLRNGFIGLCFGPLVHEYYQFSDSILPPEEGLVTRLEKIMMDQTIYLTIKCSIYISAVGLLSGDDIATVKETVKEKIGGIIFTAWKFWPLVHCVTYGLIPARHRILWVNSVDLVWNAILATKAQKEPEVSEADKLEAIAVEHDSPSHNGGGNETFSFNQETLVVEIQPSSDPLLQNSGNSTTVALVG